MAQQLSSQQICSVLEQTLSPVEDVRRNGTSRLTRTVERWDEKASAEWDFFVSLFVACLIVLFVVPFSYCSRATTCGGTKVP